MLNFYQRSPCQLDSDKISNGCPNSYGQWSTTEAQKETGTYAYESHTASALALSTSGGNTYTDAAVNSGVNAAVDNAIATILVAKAANKYCEDQRGALLFNSADSIKVASTKGKKYEFSLKGSGWFNPNLKKLLPPDMPFVLELTLGTTVSSMVSSGTQVDYTCNEVYLKIPQVTVHDQAFMERVMSLRGRGYEWNSTTFKYYPVSVSGNAGNSTTVNIADRSASLKALICRPSLTDAADAKDDWIQSGSNLCLFKEWQAQIGTDLYPPQKIDFFIEASDDVAGTQIDAVSDVIVNTAAGTAANNISEAWAEAQRVFGKDSVVTELNFAGSEAGYGCGVACVDLQAYHQDKRTTSGIDTASNATPISFRFIQGQNKEGSSTNLTLHFYAMADITFVAMPGGELRSII